MEYKASILFAAVRYQTSLVIRLDSSLLKITLTAGGTTATRLKAATARENILVEGRAKGCGVCGWVYALSLIHI